MFELVIAVLAIIPAVPAAAPARKLLRETSMSPSFLRLSLVGRFVVAWSCVARVVSIVVATIALPVRFSVALTVSSVPLLYVNISANLTVDIHIRHQAGVLLITRPLCGAQTSIMVVDWHQMGGLNGWGDRFACTRFFRAKRHVCNVRTCLHVATFSSCLRFGGDSISPGGDVYRSRSMDGRVLCVHLSDMCDCPWA